MKDLKLFKNIEDIYDIKKVQQAMLDVSKKHLEVLGEFGDPRVKSLLNNMISELQKPNPDINITNKISQEISKLTERAEIKNIEKIQKINKDRKTKNIAELTEVFGIAHNPIELAKLHKSSILSSYLTKADLPFKDKFILSTVLSDENLTIDKDHAYKFITKLLGAPDDQKDTILKTFLGELSKEPYQVNEKFDINSMWILDYDKLFLNTNPTAKDLEYASQFSTFSRLSIREYTKFFPLLNDTIVSNLRNMLSFKINDDNQDWIRSYDYNQKHKVELDSFIDKFSGKSFEKEDIDFVKLHFKTIQKFGLNTKDEIDHLKMVRKETTYTGRQFDFIMHYSLIKLNDEKELKNTMKKIYNITSEYGDRTLFKYPGLVDNEKEKVIEAYIVKGIDITDIYDIDNLPTEIQTAVNNKLLKLVSVFNEVNNEKSALVKEAFISTFKMYISDAQEEVSNKTIIESAGKNKTKDIQYLIDQLKIDPRDLIEHKESESGFVFGER